LSSPSPGAKIGPVTRRLEAGVGVLLLAAACGGGGDEAPATEGSRPALSVTTSTAAGATGEQTLRVQVDGKAPEINSVFAAFFPDSLAAHPGDTIEFAMPHFSGDPHTVTFGTLQHTNASKLPPVFPVEPPPGPPDVNRAGAQPCFLDEGEPPFSPTGGGPACPARDQPELTGRAPFYNSGVLSEGQTFSVRLAGDIAKGTYQFVCLVHGTRMTGKLNVVDRATPVPPASAVDAAGKRQLAAAIAALGGPPPAAGTDTAEAGGRLFFNGFAAEFMPRELSVPVGGTVTWKSILTHTITFNASEDAVGLVVREPDGTVRINQKAVTPANSPRPPPEHALFDTTSATSATIDGGNFDGNGFKSSGLFSSNPDAGATVTYTVTFTAPGTYLVRCLVHPDMKGQVKVS
jgi:plastocyanin